MGGGHRVDRQQSNSPPAQQLSKRDKKRTLLAERLADITAQFSANRDIHYREQLQALQIDMNLIMEADTHGREQLRNDPVEIDDLVQENIRKTMMKSIGPTAPPRAGKVYADFAKDVNDAMEQRDASLVTHKRDFDVKLSELESAHAYRKKLAATEHKHLSNTLRDRLINSVTNKKNRLSRDKETMEIGESNALLLHPSQFGIANPSSPGGIHGKRATRHHRRDAEELPTYGDSHKRKRKAMDSDESPAPSRQRIDNGSSTPIWFAEKHSLTASQIDSSLYSIDKLFTEKELAMTYNTAALAAHSHMQRHPPFEEVESPPNGKSDSSSEHEKTIAGNEPEIEEPESPPGGAMMERQYSHATRSTRGLAGQTFVTGIGIDAFNDVNIPANLQSLTRQIPKLPPLLAIQKTIGKGEAANQPAPLGAEDAAAELDMIRRARSYNDKEGYGKNLEAEHGGRQLLEVVAVPRLYNYFVKSDDKHSYVRTSNERDDDVMMGGEMMDRALSQAASDIGGVPMSRGATGEGQSSRGRRIKHKD
ncbi:Sds3-like-domain-containing protein [Tricladium varicosporioides]|nr:Sds3-like-domain-containing protein [Hymenoscyphus varicosporioides]